MSNEIKICPNCNEKNNPTLPRCWRCGYDWQTKEFPKGDWRKVSLAKKFLYCFLSTFWILIFNVPALPLGFLILLISFARQKNLKQVWLFLVIGMLLGVFGTGFYINFAKEGVRFFVSLGLFLLGYGKSKPLK